MKSDEVMWVTVSQPLKERLEQVSRRLHCSPSEAATLAIQSQLDRLPEVLRKAEGATVPSRCDSTPPVVE